MKWIFGYYVVDILIFLLLLYLGWRYFDRRYLGARRGSSQAGDPDEELEPTNEVFIDPKDGITYRVFFNRKTGDRIYKPESRR